VSSANDLEEHLIADHTLTGGRGETRTPDPLLVREVL
jgi:hypothetical protein